MAIILYATPICGRLQGISLTSLDWVIRNNYLPVNSEKTIFKKTNDYIIHGPFVDDVMHISSCDELREEFTQKYSKNYRRRPDKNCLRLEVEQKRRVIKLHFDYYIQHVLTEFKEYMKKMLLIPPGVVLKQEDVQEVLEQRKQKYYWSFFVNFSLQRPGSRWIYPLSSGTV
jgi:hypothetical protein